MHYPYRQRRQKSGLLSPLLRLPISGSTEESDPPILLQYHKPGVIE